MKAMEKEDRRNPQDATTKNVKQTRAFIGAISFYRDMFPRRSHNLTPLTNLTGKGNFVWNTEHQHTFQIMKALIGQDCMLRYPDCKQTV
jgi:hypothetical protein